MSQLLAFFAGTLVGTLCTNFARQHGSSESMTIILILFSCAVGILTGHVLAAVLLH
jgi:hypothetical protein